MAKSPLVESPLVLAVSALEEELNRYAELVAQAKKLPVNSEKNLQRAAQCIHDSTECQQKIGEKIGELLRALEETGEKQKAAMMEVATVAHAVEKRALEFKALTDRFAALGEKAKELNVLVGGIAEATQEGARPDDLLDRLATLRDTSDQVVNDADALTQAAKAGDWPELARAADSIKQQVQAARNKVLLAHRAVASQAAS